MILNKQATPLRRLSKNDRFRWIWKIKFGDEWIEGPCKEYHEIPSPVMVIQVVRGGVVGRFGADPKQFKRVREREY